MGDSACMLPRWMMKVRLTSLYFKMSSSKSLLYFLNFCLKVAKACKKKIFIFKNKVIHETCILASILHFPKPIKAGLNFFNINENELRITFLNKACINE